MNSIADRSEPRIAITLDAILHPERGRTWACTIRDFCESGMLLQAADGHRGRSLRDSGVDVRRADQVNIHFSVPGDGRAENYRIVGEVARVLDNGLGIRFPDGIAVRAFRSLDRYARAHGFEEIGDTYGDDAQSSSSVDPTTARAVLGEVRELTEKTLPQLLNAFFERAHQEMLVLARDAGSNARQNMLFEALNDVEEGAQDVSLGTVRTVLDRIAKPVSRRAAAEQKISASAGADGKLSLIDDEQFEEWLAVADIVSKAENRFSNELMTLCMQLGMLAPPWREKESMPLSPAVIATAFDEAMQIIHLERDIRQLLYSYFRDALVAFLRRFYPLLGKLLEESGAFPSAEEIASTERRRRTRAAPAAPPPPEPEADSAEVEEFDSALSGAFESVQRPAAADPASRAPSRGDAPRGASRGARSSPREEDVSPSDASGSARSAPSTEHFRSGAPERPASGHPAASSGATTRAFQAIGAAQSGDVAEAAAQAHQRAPGAPMGNMFGTARELIQLQRGLPGADGLPSELPWGSEVRGGAAENIYSREEVLAALEVLRTTMGSDAAPDADAGLARRIGRALGQTSPGKSLAPEARDALEIVDGLISSIRSDAFVPESAKGWFDDLEVTFGKLAAEDMGFLDTGSEQMHPALRLLNELAELGNAADAGDGIDPALRAEVDQILARAVDGFQGDPIVFETALADLAPIVERQRRAFDTNLQRVVRQSEGSSRLVSARRAVVQQMGARLAGREVPELLIELMNPGWRNLLVHSHLRHGPDSSEFQDNLRVVDDVVHAIETGEGDVEDIVARITRGLESISFEPGRRSQLIATLRGALAGRERVDTVHIADGSIAQMLGLAHQLPDTAPAPASEDPKETARWAHFLELARGLEVGAWLGVDDDAGRTRILTVAWIGEDHSAFALVNRKGVKAHDIELREMVQGLLDDRISILDEFDMPLMERASQTMLQNMHNQLAYQATHDALTGLVNRKEFERGVTSALARSDAGGSAGAIMFMDLDQFKLINNTSGHDAGDELLRALVPNLRQALRGVRGTLARLGGDEFGVLVERCDLEHSHDVAQALLGVVRAFRFEWGGKEYRFTASIGFVAFEDDERDAPTLLQQADAACYAAKDAGRNRIQVYEAADQGMARRRGVMEWVQKIDQVLKHDRIRLTAQKIVPIADADKLPHYEVLMTVLDEEGKPLPPIDFITAAETYDRMPAVDRWIVGHALEWMAEHMSHLQRVHGFSINLSGTSLNEPGFLDFVVARLTETRVPTNKVTFEITETAAIGSMEGATRFIRRLRDLGCTFSLDDFGTGLSSYSYLRNLEVDYVKIDGVFVKDLVDSPADYAVVKSVNEIAHFLGKQTIAEFVETEAIIESLREIGVDYAQGWGVERPKPLTDMFRD